MLKTIEDKIRENLDARGWKYSFNEELGYFAFGVRIPKPVKRLDYIVAIEGDSFTVMARLPIDADCSDELQMEKMKEFLHKANWGMKMGCFEFDTSDGEIRFKVHVDCVDLVPSKAMIDNAIDSPAKTVAFYGEGIIGIIYKGFSSEDAIEHTEGETGIIRRCSIFQADVAKELGMEPEEVVELMKMHKEIAGCVGTRDVYTEFPEWDDFMEGSHTT